MIKLAIACVLCLFAAWPAFATERSVFLEDLTWTELRDEIAAGKKVALVPIGGTEQNGPLMALGKHNVRVGKIAGLIAQKLGNAIVAPVLPYVPEGNIEPPTEHMRFPGTVSISQIVFENILEQTAFSLQKHGFEFVIFLGDHGGYQKSMMSVANRITRRMKGSHFKVVALADYYQAGQATFAETLKARGYGQEEIGTHAGLADTSLMLAVDPKLVRQELLPSAGRYGAKDGIYGGNPTRASAELGKLGIDLIVDASVSAIRLAISAQ